MKARANFFRGRGFVALLLGAIDLSTDHIAAAKASPLSTPSHMDVAAVNSLVLEDFMSTRGDGVPTMTRTSPQCWLSSISTIGKWGMYQDESSVDAAIESGTKHSEGLTYMSGSAYCESMTEEQMEVFALELTNCQLTRQAMPMFDESKRQLSGGLWDECPVGTGDARRYEAASCFPLMTEFGLNLFNQILLHTNGICARLTEETVAARRDETTQRLLHASMLAVHSLENQSTLLEHQALTMVERRREMEEVFHRQADMISQQSKAAQAQQAERDRAAEAREEAAASAMMELTNQTVALWDEMKAQQSEIVETVGLRERESLSAVERMNVLISEQAATIETQRRNLEQIKEAIANTNDEMNDRMRPFSSIELSVRLFRDGFVAFKSLLNLFVSMNVVWMVTCLRYWRKCRSFLYVVFFMGFLGELAFLWSAHDSFPALDGFGPVDMLRHGTRVVAITTLLVSPMRGCLFFPIQHRMTKMDELIANQKELVSKLKESAYAANAADRQIVSFETPIKLPREQGRRTSRDPSSESALHKVLKRRHRRSGSPLRKDLAHVVTPSTKRKTRDERLAELTPTSYFGDKPRAEPVMLRFEHDASHHLVTKSNVRRPEVSEDVRRVPPMSNVSPFKKGQASLVQLSNIKLLNSDLGRTEKVGSSCSVSSLDISSIDSTMSTKKNRKRKIIEVYASSEEGEFYSANDESSASSASTTTSAKRNKHNLATILERD